VAQHIWVISRESPSPVKTANGRVVASSANFNRMKFPEHHLSTPLQSPICSLFGWGWNDRIRSWIITAGWFGVREKYCSGWKFPIVYDQANRLMVAGEVVFTINAPTIDKFHKYRYSHGVRVTGGPLCQKHTKKTLHRRRNNSACLWYGIRDGLSWNTSVMC